MSNNSNIDTNSDKNRIFGAIKKKFCKNIPKMELESCLNDGYLLALKNYDKSKSNGKSFNSYMYERIKWECLRWIKKEHRAKFSPRPFEVSDQQLYVEPEKFEYLIEGLDCSHKEVLRLRFIEKLNLTDIGNKKGYSHETARKRINEALEILRKEYI